MEKDVALREWCVSFAEMIWERNKARVEVPKDECVEDIIITIARKLEKYVLGG